MNIFYSKKKKLKCIILGNKLNCWCPLCSLQALGLVVLTPSRLTEVEGMVLKGTNYKKSFEVPVMDIWEYQLHHIRRWCDKRKLRKDWLWEWQSFETYGACQWIFIADLSERWKDVLVIELFGKYYCLPWEGEIEAIMINFYVVKSDLEADIEKVENSRLWMLFDYYLIVQIWNDELFSPTAKIDKTMAWIRVPWLNVLYTMMRALSRLCCTYNVDSHTLNI